MTLIVGPLSFGRMIPGDLVDARFNLVMLEYFWHCLDALFHGHKADFINAPFLYPWPKITNFADTFWGQGETYALARALGCEPYAAFQAWFIAGFLLNYISAFLCLRRFGIGSLGAGAGAFLFTFALSIVNKNMHAQLLYRIWIPPAMLAMDRFLRDGRLTAGAACALFIALQLLTNMYTGLFLVLLAICYAMPVIAIRLYQGGLPRSLPMPGLKEIAIAITLLLAAAIILTITGLPYLQVEKLYAFRRSWEDVAEGLPQLSFYIPSLQTILWPRFSGHILPTLEQDIYPGIAAYIALVWLLLPQNNRKHRETILPMAAAIALMFALTTVFGHVTPFRLLYHVPAFSALRNAARVILVMIFPLSVLLGFAIDDMLHIKRPRLVGAGLAALLALILVAELCSPSYSGANSNDWRSRDVAFAARIPRKLPDNAILAVAGPFRGLDTPSNNRWAAAQVDAQLYVTEHDGRTINGYTSNAPTLWRNPMTCADAGIDINAALHFRSQHGLPVPTVGQEQIVLIGFEPCDKTTLLTRYPELTFGHEYSYTYEQDGTRFLADGFSGPESWGRWTDGKNAYLHFFLAHPVKNQVRVRINAMGFSPRSDGAQTVDVSANGIPCGGLHFTATANPDQILCPANALRAGNNSLHFVIDQPEKPALLYKHGEDNRDLGMGLETMTIDDTSP